MATIADLFFSALLEDKQLQLDAVTAGDKAGQTLGQRMSTGIAGALKTTAFAAVTLGLGFATKGLVELDQVTADYRRETGATAEEADRASKAINAISGRNIQPMKEIGAVMAAVKTQMGLTGDAQEQMTERILRYARATKQEGVPATEALDNILDAWNLTADHGIDVMNKLVASHEKYGGSIEANQHALAAMAPQLKALNLTIDDGIGLLNLFASTGLDAAAGQKALNAAISKLPKGETLGEFIKRLSTITDDGQRAQEAMKVFGTRAGAGLANAIKPGVSSLDAFKVSTDQAAGAMDRAADAANSSFGAQIQLKIKAFGSAMNSAFKDAGPLLTGLGALATLGATLGVDDLLRTLAPKLIAGMKAVGTQAGDALSDGIANVWSGAGGTVIGNNIASRIESIIAPGESGTGKVVRAAGAKLGTALSVAFTKSLVITDALVSMFVGLPVAPGIRGAIAASGAKMGAFLGSAIGLGLITGGALLLAIPLSQWADQQMDAEKRKVADSVQKAISDGTMEGLEGAEQELQNRLRAAKAGHLGDAVITFYEGQLAQLQSAIRGTVGDIKATGPVVEVAGEHIVGSLDDVKAALNITYAAAAKLARELRDQFVQSVNAAVDALTDAVYGPAKLKGALAELADQLIADKKQLHDLEKIKNPTAAQRRDILETKGRIAETKGETLKLRVQMALLDGTGMSGLVKELKVLAKQTGVAGDEARELLRLLGQVANVKIPPLYGKAGAGARKRAGGGYVPPGWTGTIGEEGTEGLVMFPGGGGYLIPHGRVATPAIASGASVPSVVNYYYQNTANVEGLVKAKSPLDIARELGRFARNGQFTPKPAR